MFPKGLNSINILSRQTFYSISSDWITNTCCWHPSLFIDRKLYNL